MANNLQQLRNSYVAIPIAEAVRQLCIDHGNYFASYPHTKKSAITDIIRNNVNSQNAATPRPIYLQKHRESGKQMAQAGKTLAVHINKAKAFATATPRTNEELDTVITYLEYLSPIRQAYEKHEPNLKAVNSLFDNSEWLAIPFEKFECGHIQIRRLWKLHALHKVHMAFKDPSKIAYYPSLRNAREGREVVTTLGKYLTAYKSYTGMDEQGIKAMADKYNAVVAGRAGWVVDFIGNDPQAWVDAYASHDVSSCMQGEDAVRVYAHEASELKLAVLKAGDKVIARCIVRDDPNETNTGYIRVYPDANGTSEGRFLLDYIKTNGYAQQSNLCGCLLQHIPIRGDDRMLVCPYIDSGNDGDASSGEVVTRNGTKYIQLGGGDLDCSNTGGYVGSNTMMCSECGDDYDEDDMTYVECVGETICPHCLGNEFTYAYGRRYQDYYRNADVIYCQSNSEYYLADEAHNHDVHQCEYSGDWYILDDMRGTSRGMINRDDAVCLDHEDSEGNSYASPDDVHTLSDDTTCHDDDAEELQGQIDSLSESLETEETL